MTVTEKKERKTPFMGVSVDVWLDEKRKLDGAEGLWRIHDKLYDFTMWSRIHPGGKFWLDISRGTDITEAFESHHLSNKAESHLQKYYIREALTPRNFFTVFYENGFYKTLKRKLRQKELVPTNESSFALRFFTDSLAIAVFLTSLCGIVYGVTWTVFSGILLGILLLSSHNFLHLKDNWRIHYLNLSLMSSRDWRIRHVLGHHQYRNTNSDLEILMWQPFAQYESLDKYKQLLLNLLLFPFSAHIQFFQRCLEVFLSIKLGFQREELIPFSLPLFMYLFSGAHPWRIFIAWNLTLLVASFVFCLISFLTNGVQKGQVKSTERAKEDFGAFQLSHTGRPPIGNQLGLSFLTSFRGNVLHYLCPTINCESLRKLVPVFEETADEFGIEWGKSFAEELQNRMPQGHLFFG